MWRPVSVLRAGEAEGMRGNGNIRGFLVGMGLAALAGVNFRLAAPAPDFVPIAPVPTPNPVITSIEQRPESKLDVYIEAYVTGYNTEPTQTDRDPCVPASGVNICGRRDTIACPPLLPFGTLGKYRRNSLDGVESAGAGLRNRAM